jgi:hypothetical protein
VLASRDDDGSLTTSQAVGEVLRDALGKLSLLFGEIDDVVRSPTISR